MKIFNKNYFIIFIFVLFMVLKACDYAENQAFIPIDIPQIEENNFLPVQHNEENAILPEHQPEERRLIETVGGISILYEADIENPTSADMYPAWNLIRSRLDRRGYLDAVIVRVGPREILVDIPGFIGDAETIAAEIGATAMLTFVDDEGNVFLTGEYVANALGLIDPNIGAGVSIDFSNEGARIFEQATRDNLNRQIFIFMDDTLIAEPFIYAVITDGSGIISGGNITMESALELATQIQQGSLPFGLTVVSMEYVPAS